MFKTEPPVFSIVYVLINELPITTFPKSVLFATEGVPNSSSKMSIEFPKTLISGPLTTLIV